ncbi:glycosyltransferase family 4 protein [Actinotalea soli]|uniref:glycosyltransferase family 4 protein n=1 Tax=Actinotalea soli TaxID=2819234 RepID=UPI0027DC127C|nr:glycosyltransferase family 4 protein [Actinotalea soli]
MTRPPARVLVVVQNLSVPLDRRVWLECQALVAAGHQVSVICPREVGQPAHRTLDGVRIHTYPPAKARSGILGYFIEFVYAWLRTAVLSVHVRRNEGFDVLQACNPPDTYWLLARLHKLVGRKAFVYDQHDLCPEVFEARFGRRGLLHRGLLLLERATYATADHVISTNESYREIASTRGKVPLERSTIVMSAPDPDRMRSEEPDPALRHGREHLVCYLGIMGPQDGVDRLLGAIDHYVNVLGRTDTHFGLMGFGDCLEDLRAQSTRLGLDEYVTFTGKVGPAEISRWLSSADLGVTPDPVNDFNDKSTMNKTMEYMAYELPVVGFDLTENRRSAGAAGLVVHEDDDGALARGIATLLDDPERRHEMGALGRKRIEEHLRWSTQAEAYVGVFRALS